MNTTVLVPSRFFQKLVVKNKAGVLIPVRCRMEERRIHSKNPVCENYPNCDKGDNCPFPHGREESKYWSGMSYIIEAVILCLR